MRQPQQGLSVIGRVLHAVRPEAVDVVSHSHSEVSWQPRPRLTRMNLVTDRSLQTHEDQALQH